MTFYYRGKLYAISIVLEAYRVWETKISVHGKMTKRRSCVPSSYCAWPRADHVCPLHTADDTKTDHVCPLYGEDDQERITCVLFIDAKVPSSHKLNSIRIETDAEIVFCFMK